MAPAWDWNILANKRKYTSAFLVIGTGLLRRKIARKAFEKSGASAIHYAVCRAGGDRVRPAALETSKDSWTKGGHCALRRVCELAAVQGGPRHFPVREPRLGLRGGLQAAGTGAAGPRPRHHPLRYVQLLRCGAQRTDPRSHPRECRGGARGDEAL